MMDFTDVMVEVTDAVREMINQKKFDDDLSISHVEDNHIVLTDQRTEKEFAVYVTEK